MLRALYGLATVVVALSIQATAQAQVNFDFSVSNGGFTASVVTGDGTNPWLFTNSPAGPGGATAWSTGGVAAVSAKALTSPDLFVQANGTVTGSFNHRFNFEGSFDGGQLQFSVNGGAFNTVPQDQITGVTYSATISSSFASPISGQRAFNGTTAGYATPVYVTSNFTLGTGASPFLTGSAFNFTAGDTVDIRFLGAWDNSVVLGSPNWQIGTLDATNLSFAAVPEPTTWALMGSALVGAGGWGYRRFKKKQQPAKTRFTRKK